MMQKRRGKPRVLVLAPRLPLPSTGGPDLRVLQTVQGLARVAEVGMFGLEGSVMEAPAGVAVWRRSRDPAATDARSRTALVLRSLAEPSGHPYDRFVAPGIVGEVETLVGDFRPDLVVLEMLAMGGYADILGRAGLRVV